MRRFSYFFQIILGGGVWFVSLQAHGQAPPPAAPVAPAPAATPPAPATPAQAAAVPAATQPSTAPPASAPAPVGAAAPAPGVSPETQPPGQGALPPPPVIAPAAPVVADGAAAPPPAQPAPPPVASVTAGAGQMAAGGGQGGSGWSVALGTALGRVLRREGGELILAFQPGVKVSVGMRVAFLDEYDEEAFVGQVVRVGRKTFRVRMFMNEGVPPESVGYLTLAETTGSLVAPKLGEYLVSVALMVRPWLGLDGSQSGMLVDGSVRLRVGKMMRISLVAEPYSPALGSTGGALEMYAAPSFVFGLAEIGLGIGASTTSASQEPLNELGVLVTPHVRIGAEDGLYFKIRTGAVIRNGVGRLSSFRLEGQIPLTYGLSLLLGGGGGASGYSFGEMGLEMLVAGNGSSGSWFVQTMIGGGGTTSTFYQTNAGPYMGIGAEARF